MADSHIDATANGPVHPTAGATVPHRPLGWPDVQLAGPDRPTAGTESGLAGGLLPRWQQRNREASLPLALRQLENAGNLDNLRSAVSGPADGYRGPVFMDSDVYKTLEAISWEVGRRPDSALAEFAGETTALLAKAQQPDGYLNSYVQVTGRPRYVRLESSHELYCAGHLIQAAVAASRTFDNGALLQVARRFADHLVSEFLGNQGKVRLDGHPIVETALVELYRQTGAPEYLQLARQFVDQRGYGQIGDSGFGIRYLQDHQPVRESTALAGHAVRALYLESGVVDVAVETGDTALLASSIARWADMVATKMALTGGTGSRHSGEAFGDAFELPPDRAYNETCAAIASFQWSWRLLLATGDAKYADLMERLLYNGFGASVSASGQQFFYVNPLQRRHDHFEDDDPGRRREWFSCACCPPNIMRLVASLQHYLASVRDSALYLHQFAPAQITAPLADGTLTVTVSTNYPWDGSVSATVDSAPAHDCGLAVRIPGWSRDTSVRLNGEPIEPRTDEHGYLVIHRRWQAGDVLSVGLDVRPRLTYPSRSIDAVRGTVAVERGPLVYCFEQADQPDGQDVADLALTGGLTERTELLPGCGPTVVVIADAIRMPTPGLDRGLPYLPAPDRAGPGGSPARAAAIPYFQWDNRDGRAMRIWMPLGRAEAPAARPNPDSSPTKDS